MVARKPYVPERGEVVWIDLNPTKGHEQKGRRPAIVLSPQTYNRVSGMALLCPITSQVKGYPFEVSLAEGNIEGVVLVDQIRSFDWKARKLKKEGAVSEASMREIQKKLQLLLF